VASAQPESLSRLIERLMKLPSVGQKTATRLAYYLLRASREEALDLAQAIVDVRERIHACPECGNLTDLETCGLCTDEARDRKLLCVVEEAANILPVERSREFRGLYHVLGGVLSPLRGVSADDLRIPQLLERVRREGVQEVVIATSSNVEGEATAHYLQRLLKPQGVRVTRIAAGLPVGSDLEYADELTLGRALAGRRDM